MRHIISILLENEPGALSKIVGVFSQRNFNIETLNVAHTEDITLSRLTLTTNGEVRVIEQIIKQLNKLVDVVQILDLTEVSHIARELMLIKVKAFTNEMRAEIKRITEIFRANIVDVTTKDFIIQITGDEEKLDAFIRAIVGISEVVRTGVSGITRVLSKEK
ncbi:Acetolactate synthase isozyme 3 small subunit [Candidatus Portiera aleyrodidarum]|uniref:acetolactate synthase small subunit n=1 Tax=Candidatus Portiera aleyrodidarum TaxID=91844 RepID=UPI0005D8876F|nr:acetolactate synthase small subunit [Candidatus Portiera aleyrodidarum]CEL12355.1 Acetolactate synthase isozyme 3 small subunit [Candidatus Portiera aleyrodidarum]